MDDRLEAMDRSGEAVTIDTNRQIDIDSAFAAPVAPTPKAPRRPKRPRRPAAEAKPDTESTESETDGVDVVRVVEALLFSSDAPLSAARLAELAGTGTPGVMRKYIDELNSQYAAAGLSFRVEKIAGGYQLLTEPVYRPWLAKLNQHRRRTRLSNAALETLSIVAYKQPIIRAEIEAIRGVACGDSLNRLREMGLVKVIGRADMVGRPMLYGTTKRFLDLFGLGDIEDLPALETIVLRRAPDDAEDEQPEPTAASA